MSNNNQKDNTATRDVLEKDFANVKGKFQETGDALRQGADHAVDHAKNLARNTVKDAKNALDDARDKAGEFEEDVIKYVRKNPVKAVGFAFLAGVLSTILLG